MSDGTPNEGEFVGTSAIDEFSGTSAIEWAEPRRATAELLVGDQRPAALFRTVWGAPAEARGTGNFPVGTRCEWIEDGLATWRGEVTESSDGEWLAILHRVEATP